VCSRGGGVAVCLFASVWVGDVGGFVAEGGEEGVVLASEVGVECGGDGAGEGAWGIWWNMVPASRWVRTRHVSVGGKEPRVMMESMGRWLYVVEIVWMCVMGMSPM
jgi:hypothetical protein